MKKHFTNLFFLMVGLFLAGSATAQVFYTQDFSGGFPAGWTSVDTSGQGILWKFSKHPDSANIKDYYGEAKVATQTATNGFMYVDSDASGANLPKPHVSRLTTNAISCTGKPKVFLKFQTYIAEVNSTTHAQIRVSNDSITWQVFNMSSPYLTNAMLNPSGSTPGSISENPLVSIIDISSKAANKPKVWIQFEWTANWDYWWFLDDISLSTKNPIDLAINTFFYPLSTYKTPEAAIAKDSFGFSLHLKNNGSDPLVPFKIRAQVLDLTNGNAIVYQDSLETQGLAVGVADSAFAFTKLYAPELPQGLYQVKYSAFAPNGADGKPSDNVKSFNFEVSDFQFAMDHDVVTNSYRPGGGPTDWYTGNMYSMLGGSQDNYEADNISFKAGAQASELDITTAKATVYLFKVIDPTFSSFDDSSFDGSTSLDFLSTVDYQYTSDNANGDLITVPLDVNILTGGPLTLENGARYFAMVGWLGASNVVFNSFDEKVPYSENAINTLVYTDKWYLGGFQPNANGEQLTSIVRFGIKLSSKVDNQPLPDYAVNVSPNPTSNYLNLECAFDEPLPITITIADENGRVIKIQDHEKVQNQSFGFDLSSFSSGNYLVRVATSKGTKTKKFVVVH